MKDNINNLLDSYIKYIKSSTEYRVITEKLKEYTKSHNNKTIVDYYSLKIKVIDKSTYTNELIPYLTNNKLDRFIDEKTNDKKIYKLIELGTLNEDFVIKNIENKKTILDIKILDFKDEIKLFEKNLVDEIEKLDIPTCIRRREALRYEISQYKNSYYSLARQVKFFLIDNKLSEYRFQYNNKIGVLKVKNIETIYTKEFMYSLKLNNQDAFDYSIRNSDLLKSKSKKINRDIINEFKVDNYKEQLYIKILKGLFDKKLKFINK